MNKTKLRKSIIIIIIYLTGTLIFSILQNIFSDKGFMLPNYTGRHLQSFILTIIFLVFVFCYGILCAWFNDLKLILLTGGIWIIAFISFFALKNQMFPDVIMIFPLIMYMLFYPLMCGVTYIGIDYDNNYFNDLSYLLVGVFVPYLCTCVGYLLGKYIRDISKLRKNK